MQPALLLISPPYSFGKDNLMEELNYHLPPQGLLSIASFIRAAGFDVYLTDCQLECRNIESFAAYLRKNFRDKPVRLTHIGISAVTISANNACQIAKLCRDFYPEAKIIMGGAHPTVMYEEVLEKCNADVVVCGEGEITMLELMQGKSVSEIKGICYKGADGRPVVNPPRERIADLDTLPLPAYDLIPVHKYKAAEGIYRKLPLMNMITSRGCPNQCTFCSKTLGSRVSVKSPERIIEEMLVLKSNFGIREIMFHDDTFTLDKNRVHALCDLMITHSVKMSWTCFARVDTVDLPLLKKMKRAGCHQLMYGIENFDPEALRKMKKKIDVSQMKMAISMTRKAGMRCRIALIIGNPGDTKELIFENLRQAKKLRPDYLAVNIATPYPGTRLFEQAVEEDLLLTHDWDQYYQSQFIMKSPHFSPDELKEIYKKSYRDFYLNTAFIFRSLLRIRSIQDLAILIRGAFRVFRYFFRKKTERT